MVGRLYRVVSGFSFGPSEFSIGGEHFRFCDLTSVGVDGGNQWGMLGLAFAAIGVLGFLDGEFRAAFLAVPIGLAMIYLAHRFGPKTLSLRFNDGSERQFMSRDGQLISFIKYSIDEGVNRNPRRREA